MIKQKKDSGSIEKIDTSIDRNRENLTILKGIDDGSFDKLVKGFSNKKEQNKIVLSGFLNSTNVALSQLGGIKIDINHIKNYIWNKSDISKNLEKKIAKLFLKKLYESGATNLPFIVQLKDAFDIENKADIENKDIDLKTIQIDIQKFGDEWADKINSVAVSNDEIFNLLGNDINKITNFESQSLSSRDIVLDILQFEVKGIIDYVKGWGKKTEKDMIKDILPTSMIPEIFDKVKDSELEELKVQKLKLEGENAEKYNEINQKIWKKHIEIFEKMGMNKDFISALKKLLENNFDFAQLDKKQQTVLRNTLIADNIDQAGNKRANYTKFDQKDFQEFMKKLYDFENDDINIEVVGRGNMNLKIKKSVKEGPITSFSDVENFKNMDAINPIKFTVNIDNNNKEIIKDLEETKDSPLRSDGIMETHITKGGELNIGNGYKLEIYGKIITKSQLDELLNCENDKNQLELKLKNLGLYEELKDILEQIKSSENLFEEMLKSLDVKVVERNLIFDGKNVDKLSQIYVMSKLGGERDLNENQDSKITDLLDAAYEGEELGDAESGKAKAENLWNDIKSLYNDEYNYGDDDNNDDNQFSFEGSSIQEDAENYRNRLDDEGKKAFKERLRELCSNDHDIESDDKDDIETAINDLIYDLEHPSAHVDTDDDGPEALIQQEKTPEEKFQEIWESLPGDKECKTMTKGMRLYFDLGESQLPPKDITDSEKSFYCFEIVDVGDTTFTIKAVGGDLPSSLSGKEYKLRKDQLESIKKGGSIYRVRADSKRDWASCLESINKAGFFKKFTAFGDMEGQVRLKGDKFVKNVVVNGKMEEVEVKYFDRVEGVFDDGKKEIKDRGQGEKIYKYEIKKINTSKGTVKLASKFDGHDENYNDVKYEYENEIPFEQFILLMEGKRLKGYTEDQQKEMETKYNIDDPKRLPTKGMRKRVSIGAIVNVFKNTSKAIKSKIEERRKGQEEDFENYLFSQEGLDLYGKLGGLLGNSSMGDAVKKMQYEFYTNRENRTWKKIEEWYKIFESDPNYSEFFNEHLQHILARQGYVGNDKDRYKFAAAFLIMVKKEGPYPRAFSNQKDKGKRVENILGPEHKVRFLNFYKKKKNELEQEKDMGHQSGARLALQEELNKMEIQYIVSTIDGRAPYGPSSNEFMLKSVWSLKFMSTLEENAKGYYNKHDEEKNSLETFYAAEESYLRNLGSGKFQKALPALERMCETAKTPGEVFRIKGYILGAMLMGIIKNNSSAKTIKSFWGTCRSMGFAPGYWMRDIEQQDKIKILLDGVTNGEFSKNPNLKYNISNFEPGNIKDGKYSFGKAFQGYWNSHGKDILKKVENPTYKNGDGDKSIVDLANEKDNPNNYVFNDIIKNSTTNEIDQMGNVNPIFAQESPLSATSNMVKDYIPQNGKYSKLKSEEDISNAEDFRTRTNDKIPNSSEKSDKATVDFMFKKFFNWFDRDITTNIQKMVTRALPLIQKEKENHHENNAKYMLWYMLKGNMHESTRGAFPPEFEQVMNKFVDFFFTNIDLIDKGTIKSTFDADVASNYDNPYIMLDWKQYRGYCMQTATGGRNKNKYKKLVRIELNKRGKEERDTINDFIGDIRNKIRHYSSPDIQPDNILNYNNTNGIWVDMSKTDKEATEEENKYIYGLAA